MAGSCLLLCRCLLLLLLLSTTTTQHVHGLVLPTGLFCPYQSKALQKHICHKTNLNIAHQKLLTTCVSQSPLEDIEDFLYEFERLTYHKETSPDYQLKEFVAFESHDVLKNRHHICHNNIEENLIPFCRQLSHDLLLGISDGGEGGHNGENNSIDENLLELQRLAADIPSFVGNTVVDDNNMISITADPFFTPAFQSLPKKVQLEIEKLQDDHQKLIEGEIGANFYNNKYNKYQQQQQQYLNEMRCIEERYDIAFARFQMMMNDNNDHDDDQNGYHNNINPKYICQCEQILSALNLTEDTYKKLRAKSLGYKNRLDSPPILIQPSSSSSSLQPSTTMMDEYDYNAFQ